MTRATGRSPGPAHFVLVPGFWLGGWAWDAVAAPLRAAGHRVDAVTLPGLDAAQTDRTAISLLTQIDALAARVATLDDVVLVAHSGGGSVAYGVCDRLPHRIRRMVYVDSGPPSDGGILDESVPADAVELPLPDWSQFRRGADGAESTTLDGLSPDDLTRFRAGAVPEPARVARDPVRLANPARRDVPATVVACSLPSDQVRELAANGYPMFAELASLTNLSFIDLPTGHWPMFSKPDELAEVLLTIVG